MFYHAEFHSWEPLVTEGGALSVNELVLQLLVSSVFAWQAAIQSIRADTCECTDALLLAFCVPARMDWHNAMLTVVDINFETGWSRGKYLGLVLMLHSYGQLWNEVHLIFDEKQISKIDAIICSARVFWILKCQCVKWVYFILPEKGTQ